VVPTEALEIRAASVINSHTSSVTVSVIISRALQIEQDAGDRSIEIYIIKELVSAVDSLIRCSIFRLKPSPSSHSFFALLVANSTRKVIKNSSAQTNSRRRLVMDSANLEAGKSLY
jgi:hypothetical protein